MFPSRHALHGDVVITPYLNRDNDAVAPGVDALAQYRITSPEGVGDAGKASRAARSDKPPRDFPCPQKADHCVAAQQRSFDAAHVEVDEVDGTFYHRQSVEAALKGRGHVRRFGPIFVNLCTGLGAINASLWPRSAPTLSFPCTPS